MQRFPQRQNQNESGSIIVKREKNSRRMGEMPMKLGVILRWYIRTACSPFHPSTKQVAHQNEQDVSCIQPKGSISSYCV